MINGPENLIQMLLGFFSTVSPIGACLCWWEGSGVWKAATVVPEHITRIEHRKPETNLWVHHKNSLMENEQEEWKTFKKPLKIRKRERRKIKDWEKSGKFDGNE